MKLQLKHNFDLVLLAPPPRRLKHFPYFTLNPTLLYDPTLHETAGALPETHRSSGDHRRKSTIQSKRHQCKPKFQESNSDFELRKAKTKSKRGVTEQNSSGQAIDKADQCCINLTEISTLQSRY